MSVEEKPSVTHAEHLLVSNSQQSTWQYLSSRVVTLKPTFCKTQNPIKVLGQLNRQQWLFFWVAFCGWTWDSFDFFTVSLTVQPLAAQFHRTNSDITWGITLVLMLRSVGAIVFGIAADRYGRKWPFIINNVLFIVLELATGFTSRYESFLACRALFGIAMGGLYGNVVATALEDCPPDARGILSGLLQAGYTCGYLFATVFARALVGTTRYGWRPLYWFGACPPVLIILFRLCLPETKSYREGEGVRKMTSTKALLREGKLTIRNHWLLLIYLVLLLAGINFTAHGTQDLYPTLLQNQFQFSPNEVTVTQVAANLGAMTGGVLVGYLSEIFGRRISMITMCLLAAPVLYPYSVFISSKGGVIAAAFFEQFCVQGAFGVIPGHLAELAPSSFRTLVVGTAYQLGNLASSASSTIEAKIGEQFSVPAGANGIKRYDYGTVIGIFVACSLAFVIIMVFLGPEKKGVRLDGDAADAEPRGKLEPEETV